PEIIFLPHWFYFNLDNVSAWTRTMITPLSIVTTYRYKREKPAPAGIDELFASQATRNKLQPNEHADPFWCRMFLGLDAVLKQYDKLGIHPVRKAAVDNTVKWILDHS